SIFSRQISGSEGDPVPAVLSSTIQSQRRRRSPISAPGFALEPWDSSLRLFAATLKGVVPHVSASHVMQPLQGCKFFKKVFDPRVAKAQRWAGIGEHLRC